MGKPTFTCTKCGESFHQLVGALGHAMREHGMTRQQAQNELKLHRKR